MLLEVTPRTSFISKSLSLPSPLKSAESRNADTDDTETRDTDAGDTTDAGHDTDVGHRHNELARPGNSVTQSIPDDSDHSTGRSDSAEIPLRSKNSADS